MTWVCSRHFGISVCVDTELKKEGSGLPRGNFTRTTCAAGFSAPAQNIVAGKFLYRLFHSGYPENVR